MDLANEMDGSDRASTGQCHPRVAGGSNPPAVMHKVSDRPVSVITGFTASGRAFVRDRHANHDFTDSIQSTFGDVYTHRKPTLGANSV